MAVRIRLRRTGAKNAPRYRLIVTESSSKRDGRFIEALGHYDPTAETATYEINEERALYWLSVGAQPSETAKRLLSRAGILKKFAEDQAQS
ncbi:MAG: 30S ribosomal protein S16 [Candidatus Coatesbacteria bacterium]|nr:MAG: 30S ribosomal protein S16 [Candidatus Coatesbacteria bacterium]